MVLTLNFRRSYNRMNYGEWRSLVAHLSGGQVVGGSNPLSPTNPQSQISIIVCLRYLC